jgi:Matrixin
MQPTRWIRFCAAGLGTAGAAVLLLPSSRAFSTTGTSLGLDQRDARVFNNFLDPTANDNQTPHPTWPGAVGAPMAIWKALAEWGSRLHGDGEGDPSQPGGIGSGAANFDVTWQGAAPNVGTATGNVVSAMLGCGGGLISVTEISPTGWRIRLCEDVLWDDGPGTVLAANALDIQGAVAHEYGHVLGLGHSNVAGATMFAALSGNGVAARSIEADDIAGVQFVYGAAGPAKPRIEQALTDGTKLVLFGASFAPTNNEVWLTMAGSNPTGDPVVVSGLNSTLGGKRIELVPPPSAGPGDVLVRIPGTSGASLSNAFPIALGTCSEPVVYCTAQTNSLGCLSAISSSGSPSASAGSGFVIEASNLRNVVPGIFFYGKTGPTGMPMLGGFLCASPPLVRTPGQSSGGTLPPTLDCTGQLSIDFNAWIAAGSDPGLVAGQNVFVQAWSRDPAHPSGSNLTNAVGFMVCP